MSLVSLDFALSSNTLACAHTLTHDGGTGTPMGGIGGPPGMGGMEGVLAGMGGVMGRNLMNPSFQPSINAPAFTPHVAFTPL